MFWRRRLPHWVPEHSIVFVTWRLAGTLPQPPPRSAPELNPGRAFVLQDRQLDRAPGPQWLKDPRIAGLVAQALLHGETVRRAYDLLAWVIMPNHVHVVLQPQQMLPEILRWFKATTAGRANRVLGRTGAFWQREYFDHWIRDRRELLATITYVEENPACAGLVKQPDEWRWSSATQHAGDKIAGVTA